MNKKIRNIATLMVLAFAGTSIATAQVSQQKIGQNPMTINPNAVLDIESNNKGLLLPRLALTATDNVAPLTAHVAGMTVYNTATNGDDETAVTPGYYYNDGTQWVRIVSSADMKTEPWYNQDTNTEATENTQNIYQMGKVAIGRDETVAGARLDVAGNVTVGEGNTFLNDIEGLNSLAVGMGNHVGVRGLVVGNDNTVTGVNSFAVGSENEVTGPNSIAMGAGSNATGTNSIAIGNYATASAANSVVLGGSNNTSSGLNAFSGGSSAVANGDNATAFGLNVTASSFAEIVLGKYNAITTGTVSSAVNTDPLFQIGNGLNDTGRANALTILKNGNVGIANEAIAPTERVDVGSGNVRVRDINTVAGTATDKIVVADTDGVLKTVEASTLSADAVEPWFVQGTTDQAEDNDDDIYIMGSVAIGTDETDKTLEVVGDFKAQVTDGDIIYGTEVNSPLNPASGMHYWMDGATGNYRVVTAHAGAAGMEAKTGAATVGFAAEATQASMNAKQDDNSAYSMIRTLNTGNFFMETYNVADNYGSTFSLQNDALRLVHSETDGLSNIIADENRSEILLQKENGVRFNFRDEDGDIKGEYWFPTEQGNEGEVLTRVGGNQTDWVSTRDMVAMPKFFYMPSIIVPTSNAQLAAPGSGATGGDSFNDVTRQGTIDLHARYTAQFGTPMVTNTTQTTTLPTLAAGALDYNITWYDINVFSAVSVNNLGVMTYTVAPGADITVGSFMNIVFAVKEDL